jgi:hypothetical protein
MVQKSISHIILKITLRWKYEIINLNVNDDIQVNNSNESINEIISILSSNDNSPKWLILWSFVIWNVYVVIRNIMNVQFLCI